MRATSCSGASLASSTDSLRCPAPAAYVTPHHALFRSLLYEACGRTINPVSGAIGLMWTGNWDLCQAAAEAVLRGESLRALSAIPAAFTDRDMAGLYGNVDVAASSSPEHSSSTPSRKRKNCGRFLAGTDDCQPPAGLLLQPCELHLCLTPASLPAGGRPGCGTSNEDSGTTTCEEASGDVEAGVPTLLNLFS